MRNYLFLLLLVCAAAAVPAHGEVPQPKDVPLDASYLRDHAETRGFLLGRPVKAKPTPDGKSVLFLRSQPRKAKLALYEFDVATRKTRELLTPEQVLKGAEEKLSAEEKARRERQRVSVGGFTDYQLSDDGALILLPLSGRLYTVKRADGAVTELQTGPGVIDPKFAPDGKTIAYVREYDLYVYDLAANKERRLTTGGSEKKTHGLAEFVAQEEMHRHTGYWWSPDSTHLAYEEADAEGVEVWHVADPIRPESRPHPSYYPRPGKANVKVRLGIIPASGGQTVWIDWDRKKYEYLAQVRWDKKGPLTLAVQTRDQKEVALLKADPSTGQTTRLLVERDPAWVNLEPDVPRWLPDGRGFLWVSEADGGPQLELRDPAGKRLKVLVRPDAGFRRLVDVDEKHDWVFFQASPDPGQSRVYFQGLTAEPGRASELMESAEPVNQSVTFAKNHSVYVLTETTPSRLPSSRVHELAGHLGELPSVAESPKFTPKVEFLQVGEGGRFHAAVVRPHGFDPKKKYPMILDVYGGPGHVHVTKAMRSWLLDQWLADQGFIVVAIDNRGTPGRGRDWERALSKKFGSVPLDDQVAGLQALGRKFPEMDLERVGVVGWSFGGYMAGLAVLKRPDVFKAAVAGAPVVDWEDYDTHYTERYLGMPDTDKGAYKEASLLTYAADLKRPLLLVHGTADDNVYFRHTLKLADALFRAGKEFDLLPLSGLTHMVPDPVVTQRLWSRIAGHFQKHLGKPG